jgi:hypothetical protein
MKSVIVDQSRLQSTLAAMKSVIVDQSRLQSTLAAMKSVIVDQSRLQSTLVGSFFCLIFLCTTESRIVIQ